MERLSIDADRAFELLIKQSETSHEPLYEVAAKRVDNGHPFKDSRSP
ncbi:ANTAR domain-containing protein [Rhodococcus tibetensis]|uniref:ANTAR domain-containing protein n=1 Tax=Rhodococcus tibetensis TaxID=2965064 RepID=A0ABT1Q8N0_9NOCA|nr:ANTAR domain-containing protein [Rhodococcus sp. FXJ9.536]MCQ4118614.1 ANTAR domain-containing protein [Rhodococcus sp. FXJ9.536]